MSSEATIASRWLYATLSSDATLAAGCPGGFWDELAPEGTLYPLVVWQQRSAEDRATVNAKRIWTELEYLVKVVVTGGSLADADALAARIDVLLQRATAVVAGGRIISCERRSLLRMLERTPGGVLYQHLGGRYRLRVQQD